MTLPSRPRFRLGADFGPLEDRLTPAQFGIPWPDAGHLTVSFAPDYTPTPVGPSLSSLAMASAPGWQREVLRAFQTWAVNANLNVGLVGDTGLPLGTPGAVQGDKRFGDVRVATAAVQDPTELAFASPFTWTGSTFAGDIILDSTKSFGVGAGAAADVFTVAAHEAGHALGLAHSPEAGSVMNETYSYRTGLSAGDVANVQALYGARLPDAYDAAQSNDTPATASSMQTVPNTGNRQLLAVGDITTAGDVDYYRVPVPTATLALTVRLKVSGESLFTGKVTITNKAGQVLATAAATDPLNNDLTLTLAAPAGGDYYVRVEGASQDVFGRGGYRLVADLTSVLQPLPAVLPVVQAVVDAGTNNTPATATVLQSKDAADSRFDASFQGVAESPTDSDYYKVRTSKVVNGSLAANVIVWGTDAVPMSPILHVYDAAGQPVPVQVVANDTGVYSIRVADAQPNQDYYIQVMARAPGSVGGYFMGVDFNQYTYTGPQGVAAGSVANTQTGSLALSQSGVYQFAVTAAGGGVALDLTDAAGNTVLSLTVDANKPASTHAVYLAADTYTVTYRYRAPAAGTAAPAAYGLFVQRLSDPIGPKQSNVSGGSSSSSSDGGYTYNGSSSTQSSGMSATY